MPSPFASSLHLSVHVEPDNVPTLMLPSDCISVDTYKIPVLIEPELVVPVVLNEPAAISPVAVVEANC